MLYGIVGDVRTLSSLFSSHFFKGSLVFGVASFITSVLNYFFNLIVARGFDLNQYGEYMSALSYSSLLAVPFSALNIVIIARIGALPVEERLAYAQKMHGWLLKIFKKNTFLLALFCGGFISIAVFFANITFSSAVFILSVVVSGVFVTFYLAILQAQKRFLLSGAYLSGISLVKVLAGLVVLFVFPSLTALYVIIILASIFGIVIGAWYIGALGFGPPLVIKGAVLRQKSTQEIGGDVFSVLRDSKVWLPTITMLGVVGMIQLDLVLVKYFFSGQDAGLYAGLSLLGKMVLYVSSPLSLVAFTYFTAQENKHERSKIAFLTVFLLLLSGGIISLLYFWYAEFIVLLIFGEKFLAIAPYAWLCAIFGTLYSIVSLFAQYLLAQESKIALLSLFGLTIQTILLLAWHGSFAEVLLVNSVVSLSMIVLYIVCSSHFVWQKILIHVRKT